MTKKQELVLKIDTGNLSNEISKIAVEMERIFHQEVQEVEKRFQHYVTTTLPALIQKHENERA